jgi:dUTP pyrophosphatase
MQAKIPVPLQVENEELIPIYSTQGASGADIRAHIESARILEPGSVSIIPTGVRMAVPVGYEIQVRPRSGLAAKHGITVLNTPGTIDADYRGEICVIMINLGKNSFTVEPGMRIAQIVLAPVCQAEFVLMPQLVETARGTGGFGHTGTH